MAYDQGYYQQPQRPYNGAAAQRPRPPQGYQQQPPPPQQYTNQGYDQYPEDGYDYGYDQGYDQGYGQSYNGGYQDYNGGRGNEYLPQDRNYPQQQQEYYPDQRGGAMPQQNRGRGNPPPRPPTADSARGYDQRGDQGRGYANGGAPAGRGGRPAPLERNPNSDPGREVRKPLKTPPISPDVPAWDNPFPTFPGAKKKTSREEEQDIVEKMAAMDVGTPQQSRSKQGNGQGGQERERYGAGRPTDDYGRPSTESQRSIPRGQPQGYPESRRVPPGPASRPSYDEPRQNGYGSSGYDDRRGYGPPVDDFGPPSRSNTMPNQPTMEVPRNTSQHVDPVTNERPYNGPIGRAMPPRPSTATGVRAPPQRIYPNQAPVQPIQSVQPPSQQYAPLDNAQLQLQSNHWQHESVSDFYDHYYDGPETQSMRNTRSQSLQSEMPNFNSGAQPRGGMEGQSQHDAGLRKNSWEQQQNGYGQQVKPVQSQPDYRARAQPQAAVFEMADSEPPMPNNYQQGYPNDRYAPQNDQYNNQHQGWGGYDEPHGQNGYQLPPRSTSAASRNTPAGLPNGPKNGFNGLPNGPSPQQGGIPTRTPTDPLPSHPAPVRAGLIPGSVANLANNKPVPVRHYDNVAPAPTPQPQPQVKGPKLTMPAPPAPTGPPPVTNQELDQLRQAVKSNPNDQASQLKLSKKMIEACDVLVPKMTDQRQRAKTREKYVLEAHKILKKLVAAQNTEAMFFLADCHGRGSLGLEIDNKEAFTLYQSAAKAGHAAAAYRTAVCCELGNESGGGTRKDPTKAIQWYQRAATLGDTPAMYKMGMIQLKGLLGQPQNAREAVVWLKRAAERADAENPHAVHELGLLYEQPTGPNASILRDEKYALQLFLQAADLGYKFSQFRLGCAYEYGLLGCPIDPRQSIMWYSKAAVQEEHQSELALSGWYLTGSEGVLQQNDTEAYLWARKAAMAANAKAEYAMGYFTEVGIGIPANLDDAKRWYWRAAAQNFPKARERLEDLKKGGKNGATRGRERISRSKVGKQNEGECAVM